MLDRGLVDDLGKRRRDAAEDHDCLHPRIIELMLQLARRIERIDVHLDGAGANDTQHGQREGRDVGQHHGDAVAFADPQPVLQIGREVARQPVGVGIGQGLAEAAECRLVGKALHGIDQHVGHGRMGAGIDFGRNC